MKENAPKLGQLIDGEASKDAIHIAVAPVIVNENCFPGNRVGLLHDGSVSTRALPHLGILDPYLSHGAIQKGQQVWLLMFPNTITGLRHEWTHPAFEGWAKPLPVPATLKEEAESRLRWFAEGCGVSYDRMIGAVEDDDYISMGENERYKDVPYPDGGTFEGDCALVLGKEGTFYPPFSCSC